MNNEKIYYEQVKLPEFDCGIDQDLISPEFSLLIEELICPICSFLVWDAIKCNACDKPFCKICIDKWLKKKTGICPNRCKFQQGELSRTLRNLINKIMIQCTNLSRGCNEKISYEHYETHYKDCQFNLWKCLGKNCTFQDIKSKVLEHVKHCDNITEMCKWCKNTFKIQYYMSHFNNCDMMTETCIFCNDLITKKEMNNHNHEVCASFLIKKYEDKITVIKQHIEESKEFILSL